MPRISSSTLKAMLAAEKQAALSVNSSTLSAERGDAMDYYLGDMSKDMPPIDGRSKAVSTDVADTIEGLMPSLMEIFCGSDEVVQFEPVGPEDVAAAQQETEYVNHVFMQKNPGFLTLYSFIKDALLSKVGIVKVWWETQGGGGARDLFRPARRRLCGAARRPRCGDRRAQRAARSRVAGAAGQSRGNPGEAA